MISYYGKLVIVYKYEFILIYSRSVRELWLVLEQLNISTHYQMLLTKTKCRMSGMYDHLRFYLKSKVRSFCFSTIRVIFKRSEICEKGLYDK